MGKLPVAEQSNQILVVAGVDKTTAWVSLHNRGAGGEWQQIMTTPGVIGHNGLGKTREGDGKTPVGNFHVDKAFGLADDPGCAIPYVKADEFTYWSGDKRPRFYNRMVDIRKVPDLDKKASEHIIDYPNRYQHCLNISYFSLNYKNDEHVIGFGLFIQCFPAAKPFTEGGVAIPKDKMVFLLQHIDPKCIIVIDSMDKLGASF
ncbi:hypothetical protein [Selenomonas ruminantium]|uniref:hypothetical protein n=1 Tax=Selenomonas ruminantium TaxID=971 RepID=UPI0021151D46|nr:hypothetical protein [Selenomonas ruminantium]